MSAVALLSIAASAEVQRRSADFWIERLLAVRKRADAVPADNIRIGYLSADFRSHPVSYLAAGLFEAHDRTRFETHGFSIGPTEDSDLPLRLERSFVRFTDLYGWCDDEIVGCIEAAKDRHPRGPDAAYMRYRMSGSTGGSRDCGPRAAFSSAASTMPTN
ncbi:hypothetical protein JQ607_04205 [Bradyrhizobium liaoningense]|uniref:O-linked N-acetylglucosamine transferase family protein n=1 Tax=Bradyrhizobium liaoningense TaxID=43992 RepID=UPI001BA9AB6B|nr:hypothetical protein [Bradyrhizobium liaoningense]MBR0839390.1 hypothetical protein [Bradyrhizobium liaoningense]